MRGPHPVSLLERTAALRPEPSSAAVARVLLRSALAEAGCLRWLEDGELALSEVVTNVVLHAHTDFMVTVRVYPESLHVEVRDASPVPPVARHYDGEAATGRGMALVAAVTAQCGVERLAGDGKVVWFRVEDASPGKELSVDDLLAAWEVAGDWDTSSRNEPSAREVLLAGMPPALWLAARQHHDALLRELALYCAEHDDLDVHLVLADRARSAVSVALVQALQEADPDHGSAADLPLGWVGPLAELPERIDLRLSVPVDPEDAYGALQDALDVAEDLAVTGRLLARPGLPEIITLRDWVCDQVVAQLAGAPPRAWPGAADSRFETALHDQAEPEARGWDASAVTDSDRGALAADAANRIVAVSRRLADLLGWDVDELVGRRLVTIIPPRLREAHVAGFTAHLTTGRVHILGKQVQLPALRSDGTEVACTCLIEAAPAQAARQLFVAWIEPVAGAAV